MNDMKQDAFARMKIVIQRIVILLSLGLGYFLFIKGTGFSIPCPIRTITGYQCPGCGITHYALALLQGHFKEAMHANPFVFFLMPILLVYFVYRSYRYIVHNKQTYQTWETIVFSLVCVIGIVFGVLRNR